MSTELSSQTPEAAQLNAMATLPTDVVLLKMENEQIFSIARASPREPAKIIAQLKELLESYPAAAAGAVYSKPVGTVTEVTCGDCGIRYQVQKVDKDTVCVACDSHKVKSSRPVKKFAEGLSIRAAETIRSIYGYTRLATTTELIEDGKASLTGTIVDYAAGNITSDSRIVSPFYRARTGKMERTPDDRFLGVVVKAEKSKLRRDIILDNTPAIVKTAYRDMCDQLNEKLVTPQEIEQKIIPAFATFGLTPAHLDALVGAPRAAGWTIEVRLQLRKILVALKQEETTTRELLDGLEMKAAKPSATSGATMDDLAKPPANGNGGKTQTSPQTKPPAERQPGEDDEPVPTVPPAVNAGELFNEYCDLLSQAEGITDVHQVASKYRQAIGPIPEWTQKINDRAEMRISEIRGSRGGAANQKRMV